MGATAYVLVRGVITMASGKDVTGEQSQKWMQQPRPVPGAGDRHRRADPACSPAPRATRRGRPAWSSSTRSTRAPATAAPPGWSTAAGSARPSLRMAAIGDVDEANAAIGVAIAALDRRDVARALAAHPERVVRPWRRPRHARRGRRRAAHCRRAGRAARARDRRDERRARAADQLHPARAARRRSPRSTSPARSSAAPSARAVALAEVEPLNPQLLAYLNRLSDHLFVSARFVAAIARAAMSCGSPAPRAT